MNKYNELLDLVITNESTRLTREMDKKHDEHEAKLDGVNKQIRNLKKILDDPSTSNAIKAKVEEKINKIKNEFDHGPANHPLSMGRGNGNMGSGYFATPKKTVEKYGFDIDSAQERKQMLKNKFYAKGVDPNTRKPGRFNMNEAVEDLDSLKLEIFESCRAGEITNIELEFLLNELN